MLRAIALVLVCLITCSSVLATSFTEFAIFGASGVSLGSNVTVECELSSPGTVGSNTDVSIVDVNGGSDVLSLTGGGKLTAGANIDGTGNIIFTGNVGVGGGSTIIGNIDSGGNVTLGDNVKVKKSGTSGGNVTAAGFVDIGAATHVGDSVIEGNVLAGGRFTLGGKAQVLGNVGTKGNADLKSNSLVGGTLQYEVGKTLTMGAGATVGGGATQVPVGTVIVAPTPFSPVTDLPAPATIITTGTTTLTDSVFTALTAGAYNQVDFGTGKVLTLQSGRYDFNKIYTLSDLDLRLDLTSGNPLEVYVAGQLRFGADLDVSVTTDGGATYMDYATVLSSNPGLAEKIYWETHGDFQVVGSSHGSEWLGTVYQATSVTSQTITFGGHSQILGALYSTTKVGITGDSTINFALAEQLQPEGPPPAPIPEPLTCLGLLMGMTVLGARVRRRMGGKP